MLEGLDEDPAWVTDDNVALFTDQYELAMVQAYWREEMFDDAVFSLFVRRLPDNRNYLLACGLADALRYLEELRFEQEALEHLASMDEFDEAFLRWLGDLRFTGAVRAVPEGMPLFPDEPLLEVSAPLPQAQLVETFLMNQIHHQTVVASKAARVVEAAAGGSVVDFGIRRMHGTDAGMKAARAFHVAGVTATSNVLAGRVYGVPVTGTMAHSYVQAHDSEMDAFRAFVRLYPDTILLVDTYDTLEGTRKVVELARALGDDFRVRGIRLDSGDLAELAFRTREILDEAGLDDVGIFASGGLDEYEIRKLRDRGAPIVGFGVGTGMGVSRDAPSLDIAYKLTSYAGKGRLKLSSGKGILPGRKQIFRQEEGGAVVRDILSLADEAQPGRPLMVTVMEGGVRLEPGREKLDEMRRRARVELDALPARIRSIEPANPPYEVVISPALREYRDRIAEEMEA